MRRRLSALACALALLLPGVPAGAAPALPPYTHAWQAQGQVGGDLGGEARQAIDRSEMSMTLAGGRYTGELHYADELGVQAADGVLTGQSASIDVTLTGGPAQGGGAAAGSFRGQAVLITRRLTSLDQVPGMATMSNGTQVVYEVSGHWGALLEDGYAKGDLLFERATPVKMSDSMAAVHERAWFNRMTFEQDGGAQSFRVEVKGLAGDDGRTPEATPAAGGASAGRSPAGATGDGGLGFFDYVRRGLAGQPGVKAPPVPQALSQRARALRDATPPGAAPLPGDAVSVDVELPGAYLDAKNRAAGLVDGDGPSGPDGARLRDAWKPRVKLDNEASPAERAVRLPAVLEAHRDTPGTAELLRDVKTYLRANGTTGDLTPLVTWAYAVEAVVATAPVADVGAPTAVVAHAVGQKSLPRTGPLADAVLASVLSPRAPREALAVRAMERAAGSDATGSAAGALLPNRVLAQAGGSTGDGPATLTWDTGGSRQTLAPQTWPAYRRADGALYWLAGPEGPVALTDGTLRGAGFTVSRAYMVEAGRVGRILAVYDLR